MSDLTSKCLLSWLAVAYILEMVCLVESRPSRVGLSQEAISEWLHTKRDLHQRNENPYAFYNASNTPSVTAPRILNHPKRASNERVNGGFFANSSRSGNSGSQPRKEDAIIFPPDGAAIHERLQDVSFEPDEKTFKECSNEFSYCTNITNYPGRQIKELLQNDVDKYKSFFGKDKIIPPDLVHRIDDPGEVALCASSETTVFPKAAKNEQNNLLFIVNEADYMQGVRVEKCHEQGPCDYLEYFPLGYKAFCKQKHVFRRLLAVKGGKGKLIPDTFLFPSCCVCTLRRVSASDTTPWNNAKIGNSEVSGNEDVQVNDTPVKNNPKKVTPSKQSGKVVFMDRPVPLPLTANHELDEESH